MKTKKVNRYYCDFCPKSGCAAGHMKSHELHCTANPNRECGLCRQAVKPADLFHHIPEAESFKKAYTWKDPSTDEVHEDFTLEGHEPAREAALLTLREACGDCPACILAVLRQVPGERLGLEFDFQAELAGWWEDRGNRDGRYE